MIVSWSSAIAAAAFVVLTVGILTALRTALGKLSQLQASAAAMQQELLARSKELSVLMQQTEETMKTARRQFQAAGKLFEAAGQVGGAIAHTTSAVESISSVLSESAEYHAKRAAAKRQTVEALEWAELGMAAWQLWQTNRKAAAQDERDHEPATGSGSASGGRDEGHAKNERSD